MFTRGRALWTIPVDSPSVAPTRIPGSEDICCSAFQVFADWSSSDSIAYTAGDSTETWISVIPSSGGTPRRVTNHRNGEWFPRWSPDGRRIAFYSTWDGEMTDVWTIASDGSDLRRLTHSATEDFRPAYSPDGKWVAYTSRHDGEDALWVVPSGGGGTIRLTAPGGIVVHADWARDGQIVFARHPAEGALWSIDGTTGEGRAIDGLRGDAANPTFSSDGRWLAFATRRFFMEAGIALLDWGTGHVEPFRTGQGSAGEPAWSPDNRTLAFSKNTGGYADSRQIWVKSLDGGEALRLTRTGDAHNPSWTQDGKRIMFRAWGKSWSVPADGSARERIEPAPATAAVDTLLPKGAFDVRRSRVGSIAFVLNDSLGGADLYVRRGGQSDVRRLTHAGDVASPPAWSTDGKHIVVSRDPGHWRLEAVVPSLPTR